MKNKSLNKNEIKKSLQYQIQARYNRNAIYFQYTHNASHLDSRIWRHMLCARTFTFYAGLFLPFLPDPNNEEILTLISCLNIWTKMRSGFCSGCGKADPERMKAYARWKGRFAHNIDVYAA